MEIQLDEFLDRYTIIKLKCERIGEKEQFEALEIYDKELLKYDIPSEKLSNWINRLYELNKQIWDLESDIRKGRDKEIGFEEVGRRAIKIRDTNKKRIAVKNEIVESTGQGFKDVKMNHASDKKEFNYDYYKTLIKKLLNSNRYPLQVEIQPGVDCSGYDCSFCYGKKQKFDKDNLLEIEVYKKFINELKDKVNLITLAGIKSEPLTYPNIYEMIEEIKKNNIRVGIHTKGLLLDKNLSKLLNNNTAYGDFITFSIDASDGKTYNKLHGIKTSHLLGSFDVVYDNIKYLYKRKKEMFSDLNVNVSYLLFKENSSYDTMKKFIEMFKDHCDVIRFSIPQFPNNVTIRPDYYLTKEEEKEVREVVDKLKEEYPELTIFFLAFETNAHEVNFDFCYAQRFLFVVDKYGYVYPCPQVTTNDYNHLIFGNIKYQSFEDVLSSKKRNRLLLLPVKQMNCKICDRKDECINEKLNKELQ